MTQQQIVETAENEISKALREGAERIAHKKILAHGRKVASHNLPYAEHARMAVAALRGVDWESSTMPLPTPMASNGQSQSLNSQRRTVRDVFEQFRMSDDDITKEYPVTFDKLSEDKLAYENLVKMFATYLMEIYKDPDFIAGSTAVQYVSVLVNMICTRFAESTKQKTVRFRQVLTKAEGGVWLTGLIPPVRKTGGASGTLHFWKDISGFSPPFSPPSASAEPKKEEFFLLSVDFTIDPYLMPFDFCEVFESLLNVADIELELLVRVDPLPVEVDASDRAVVAARYAVRV